MMFGRQVRAFEGYEAHAEAGRVFTVHHGVADEEDAQQAPHSPGRVLLTSHLSGTQIPLPR